MIGDWVDKGKYYISTTPQGTIPWRNQRYSLLLTMSKVSSAVGHNLEFADPETEAKKKVGLLPEIHTEKSKKAMQHGIDTEPEGRNFYRNITGNTVTEVGLAVPKWDPRIGGSADGLVFDTKIKQEGLLEIKCPETMYKQLEQYHKNQNKEPNLDHIFISHMDQMQGNMAIMDMPWCDYFVYSTGDEKYYLERVYFDKNYWETNLYPGIVNYLDNILGPLMKSANKKN